MTDVVDFDHEISLVETNPELNQNVKTSRQYEVDILYENQRGLFFCGIPLYSHSSLLNFDPNPWVTKDLKNSAVNITNAQVPDPSWEWDWKTWYVDMSHDVDEQGWQYSFTFGNFAWHGTHPWFHSFVRRRRWLRRRIRKQKKIDNTGHHLTGDYFTIHSKRDRSPGSVEERRPMSTEIEIEEISDIATLLKALRLSTIDREKIDAIKKFTEDGGNEVQYLGERLPEILSFLIFQNSKKQLLSFLRKSSKNKDLLAAVKTAEKEIKGLNWTEKQASTQSFRQEDNPVDEIRGIPADAEIGSEPKGKEREKSPATDVSDENREKQELRLGRDTILIPE